MNRITLVVALAAASFSTAAIAQSQEEQQACMNDAFRVCSATIPDRARTTTCMIQHKAELSSACQMVMAKYAPAGTPATTLASRPATPVMTRPVAMKTATNVGRPGKPLNILMR
jgi:hypothetical protein